MKRLLDWKQRMLQSPLTRKSSRNASRTQTPTNSDSPVPSIHNDDIRKKVLEELQYTEPSQTTKEKRLSRKGSSGSRSSRSRSSPRIAPSKNQIISSDDEGDQNLHILAASSFLSSFLKTIIRITNFPPVYFPNNPAGKSNTYIIPNTLLHVLSSRTL